jgi:hypothetical protein
MYEEFIEKMYSAFSNAEKPAIDEMTPHRCIECDEVRDQIHTFDKREVPDHLLHYHGDALPLLSPKALRYYFPRYIEFGLLNQDENAFDNCLYHLAPKETDDYWRERVSIFSSEEKKSLRTYLLMRRDMEDAEFDEEYIVKGLETWV